MKPEIETPSRFNVPLAIAVTLVSAVAMIYGTFFANLEDIRYYVKGIQGTDFGKVKILLVSTLMNSAIASAAIGGLSGAASALRKPSNIGPALGFIATYSVGMGIMMLIVGQIISFPFLYVLENFSK